RDVARALKISEATVKRIFSARDCTLARLDQLCGVAQVELADIARGGPRNQKLLTRLTADQEQEIVHDVRLLVVAVCTLSNMRFEDIIDTYAITKAQCVALLARLDKLGFLELQPNNRYRPLVARTFQWIPDGPIMRWTKQHAPDYFNHTFDGPGETLRMVNIRVSAEARAALLARLEQLAQEYADQHTADAWLPLEQTHALSLTLAVRNWEPPPFMSLRKAAPSPPRPPRSTSP
ncbi:MAG: XRE family transcriptional regulator, partial [Burkholderiales bacterium]